MADVAAHHTAVTLNGNDLRNTAAGEDALIRMIATGIVFFEVRL